MSSIMASYGRTPAIHIPYTQPRVLQHARELIHPGLPIRHAQPATQLRDPRVMALASPPEGDPAKRQALRVRLHRLNTAYDHLNTVSNIALLGMLVGTAVAGPSLLVAGANHGSVYEVAGFLAVMIAGAVGGGMGLIRRVESGDFVAPVLGGITTDLLLSALYACALGKTPAAHLARVALRLAIASRVTMAVAKIIHDRIEAVRQPLAAQFEGSI